MGASGSHFHIYDKCDYPTVQYSLYGNHNWTYLPKHDSHEYQPNSSTIYVAVRILDSKRRVLKQVAFYSGANDSWIVKNDGIRKQLYGYGHSVEDWNGSFFRWSEDYESLYNQQDQKQEEEQAKEEAERQEVQQIESTLLFQMESKWVTNKLANAQLSGWQTATTKDHEPPENIKPINNILHQQQQEENNMQYWLGDILNTSIAVQTIADQKMLSFFKSSAAPHKNVPKKLLTNIILRINQFFNSTDDIFWESILLLLDMPGGLDMLLYSSIEAQTIKYLNQIEFNMSSKFVHVLFVYMRQQTEASIWEEINDSNLKLLNTFWYTKSILQNNKNNANLNVSFPKEILTRLYKAHENEEQIYPEQFVVECIEKIVSEKDLDIELESLILKVILERIEMEQIIPDLGIDLIVKHAKNGVVIFMDILTQLISDGKTTPGIVNICESVLLGQSNICHLLDVLDWLEKGNAIYNLKPLVVALDECKIYADRLQLILYISEWFKNKQATALEEFQEQVNIDVISRLQSMLQSYTIDEPKLLSESVILELILELYSSIEFTLGKDLICILVELIQQKVFSQDKEQIVGSILCLVACSSKERHILDDTEFPFPITDQGNSYQEFYYQLLLKKLEEFGPTGVKDFNNSMLLVKIIESVKQPLQIENINDNTLSNILRILVHGVELVNSEPLFNLNETLEVCLFERHSNVGEIVLKLISKLVVSIPNKFKCGQAYMKLIKKNLALNTTEKAFKYICNTLEIYAKYICTNKEDHFYEILLGIEKNIKKQEITDKIRELVSSLICTWINNQNGSNLNDSVLDKLGLICESIKLVEPSRLIFINNPTVKNSEILSKSEEKNGFILTKDFIGKLKLICMDKNLIIDFQLTIEIIKLLENGFMLGKIAACFYAMLDIILQLEIKPSSDGYAKVIPNFCKVLSVAAERNLRFMPALPVVEWLNAIILDGENNDTLAFGALINFCKYIDNVWLNCSEIIITTLQSIWEHKSELRPQCLRVLLWADSSIGLQFIDLFQTNFRVFSEEFWLLSIVNDESELPEQFLHTFQKHIETLEGSWIKSWYIAGHHLDINIYLTRLKKKFSKILALDDNNMLGNHLKWRYLIANGEIQLFHGNYSSAISWLEKSLCLGKQKGLQNQKMLELNLTQLAECYRLNGSPKFALKLFTGANKLLLNHEQLWLECKIIQVLVQSRQFNKAVKYQPNLYKLFVNRSEVLFDMLNTKFETTFAKIQFNLIISQLDISNVRLCMEIVDLMISHIDYYTPWIVTNNPAKNWKLLLLANRLLLETKHKQEHEGLSAAAPANDEELEENKLTVMQDKKEPGEDDLATSENKVRIEEGPIVLDNDKVLKGKTENSILNDYFEIRECESAATLAFFGQLKTVLEKSIADKRLKLEMLLGKLISSSKPSDWSSEYLLEAFSMLLALPLADDSLLDDKESWNIALRQQWLSSVLQYNNYSVVCDKDLAIKFWEVVQHSTIAHKLDIIQSLLDTCLKNNTIEDVIAFIEFTIQFEIKYDVFLVLVNPMNSEELKVDLKRIQKSFEQTEINRLINISWPNFEKYTVVLKSLFLKLQQLSEDANNTHGFIDTFNFIREVKLMINDDDEGKLGKFVETIHSLYTYSYQKHITLPKVLEILKGTPSNQWETQILSILKHKGTKLEDKSEEGLIQELLSTNSEHNPEIIKSLSDQLANIHRLFKSELNTLYTGKPIEKWTEKDVTLWATKVKGTLSLDMEQQIHEAIAVLQQAVFLHTKKYYPRKIGVMSVLLLLKSPAGRLQRIGTGEGKSTLVAMLAALYSLAGRTVDIVTSSAILAERDAVKDWPGYFLMLNLTVSHTGNTDHPTKVNETKHCYNCDIIYGESSAFAGDILRHEFNLMNTRGKRGFDIVIVDEVDSMFIDNSGHSTRLVEKMPAMDYMEPIFTIIWYSVNLNIESIFSIGQNYVAIDNIAGKVDLFIECIQNILPQTIKDTYKLLDSKVLSKYIQAYLDNLKSEALADENICKEVATMLKNRANWSSLSDQLQSKLKALEKAGQMGTLDQNHSLTAEYIQDKCNIGVNSNLVEAVSKLFNINIFIYDNINGQLELSLEFHSAEEILESNENEVVFGTNNLGLVICDDELYLLAPVENKMEYVMKKVEMKVKESISSSSNKGGVTEDEKIPKLKMPSHLWNLFNTKLDEWIGSAIKAKCLVNVDHDYIIKESEDGGGMRIIPVDFHSTGILQESTVWSDGLHQFLQLKHKLRITPEYLPTNYLSNVEYFRRYKTIFGMTGTLGNDRECQLLAHMYPIDTMDIPSFKPSQLIELNSFLCEDRTDWLDNISECVLAAGARHQRAVLVVCKTIQATVEIQQLLAGFNNIKVFCYARNDLDFAVVEKELDPSDVIIATNLAGRGTDIKLSKDVLANGGLHIVITSLPCNQRVERQVAGRAGRSGKPGTFQLVINIGNEEAASDNTEITPTTEDNKEHVRRKRDLREQAQENLGINKNIKQIRRKRDLAQNEQIDEIQNKLLPELKIEDDLFKTYCAIKKQFTKEKGPSEQPTACSFLEDGYAERWALALEDVKTRHNTKDTNWNQVKQDFQIFFQNLEKDIKNGTAIQNGSYYILAGKVKMLKQKYKEAIEHFDKAIALDDIFSYNAYYNRAYAKINNKVDKYKEKAVEDLTKCAEIIQNSIMLNLQQMYALTEYENLQLPKTEDGFIEQQNGTKDKKSEFAKQIISKMNFLLAQLKSIKTGIAEINKHTNVKAKFIPIEDYIKETNQTVNSNDVDTFRQNGFVGFIDIEKERTPWYNILAVFLLGALQVIAGAAIVIFTGHVNLGTGLIAEGVGDIITGIQAAVTGDFSWKEYFIGKAISIGASLLLGFGAKLLKPVAKFAATGIAKLTATIGQKTATNFLGTVFKFIGRTVKFVRTGFKYIKNGVKSIWNYVTKKVSKFTNSLMKKIGFRSAGIKQTVIKKAFLSAPIKKQLGLVGKKIVIEAVQQGAIKLIDYVMLKPLGNVIEELINKKQLEIFKEKLLKDGKVHKLLSSCQGSKYSKQIQSQMKPLLVQGNTTEILHKVFDPILKGFASKMRTLISDELKKISTTKSKSFVTSVIQNTVVNLIVTTIQATWAIVELNTIAKEVGTYFDTELEKLSQDLMAHEQNEHQQANNICTTRKPTRTQVNEWITEIATQLAKSISQRMRQLIESDLIAPQVHFQVNKITGKLMGNTQLMEKLSKNTTKLQLKRQLKDLDKNVPVKSKTYKGNSKSMEEFLKFVNNVIVIGGEEQVSNGIEILPAISAVTGESIELYKEKGTQIVYNSSYGKQHIKNASGWKEPIRLLFTAPTKEYPNGNYEVITKDNTNGEFVRNNIEQISGQQFGKNSLYDAMLFGMNKDINRENIQNLRVGVAQIAIGNTSKYINFYSKTNSIVGGLTYQQKQKFFMQATGKLQTSGSGSRIISQSGSTGKLKDLYDEMKHANKPILNGEVNQEGTEPNVSLIADNGPYPENAETGQETDDPGTNSNNSIFGKGNESQGGLATNVLSTSENISKGNGGGSQGNIELDNPNEEASNNFDAGGNNEGTQENTVADINNFDNQK